MGVMYIMTFF